MSPSFTIAVIGDGAASALLGLHLARRITGPGLEDSVIQVLVIGPHPRVGDGTAFGTSDPGHLLNVPADSMSVVEGEPGHFVDWLRRHDPSRCDPDGFVPRREFASYLRETLAAALERTRGVSLHHLHGRATGMEAAESGVLVRLDDGRVVAADGAVLATGLPPAGVSWAPFELRHSAAFVPDPWAPRALDTMQEVGEQPDVLLVGSGLTMVDVALSLCRCADGTPRAIHVVSPSGRLPHRHRAPRLRPVVPDVTGWGDDLGSIRESVRRHVAEVVAAVGDWRPAVDGLRCRIPELWSRLSDEDRETFLRTDASDWNRMRHRIPLPAADALDGQLRSGRVTVRSGRVRAAQQLSHGVRIAFDDGSTHDFGWVVNCTGPQEDLRESAGGLLGDLLRPRDGRSLIQPGTAGMGVRTAAGRVVDSAGSTRTPIWAIGAVRRGELWESTAVPEIRGQADQLAAAILDEARQRARIGRPPVAAERSVAAG